MKTRTGVTYHHGTRVMRTRCEYLVGENIKHGLLEQWDINQRMRVRMSFYEGVEHGEHCTWNALGTLTQWCYFRHGKYHGEYTGYTETGEINKHYLFIDDEIHPIDYYKRPETEEDRLMLEILCPGLRFHSHIKPIPY